MAKSLESRIAQLESLTAKESDTLTVILIRFKGATDGRPSDDEGELIGYETNSYDQPIIRTFRHAEESEDSLLERAMASAKPTGSCFVFHEMRA